MNLNATLIIEVASFLILLALLGKFLYRPVLAALDKRAAEIKEANDNIQKNLAFAQKQRAQAEQVLAESKNEALKLKEQISLQGERLRQNILAQAKAEAARLIHTSQQEIAAEVKRAQEELEAQVADLSFQTAEKILRRSISPGDQQRLIKELTEGIDGGRSSPGP